MKNKKVKVRIAVCVTAEGSWGAAGWPDSDDDELMSMAWENADRDHVRQYFLDAELEPPASPGIVDAAVREIEPKT